VAKLIQIYKDDSLHDMAEKTAIAAISRLAVTNKTNLQVEKGLELIRTSQGEESYKLAKDAVLEIMNNNIIGFKSFINDLIAFIEKNDGQKFKISITKIKENQE
jgi:hypothetical protein